MSGATLITRLGAAACASVESAPPWYQRLPLLVLLAVVLLEGVFAPVLWRWLRDRGSSGRLALGCAAAMIASGLLLWGAGRAAGLDLERNELLIWTWVCLTALAAGATGAAVRRKVPGVELAIATVVVLEIAASVVLLSAHDPTLADPPVRALLVLPVIVVLAAYFGASVGYLVFGDAHGQRGDLALGYEAVIGRRFLLAKASGVLSTVTAISLLGVALGVWLVITSLAVLSGFEYDLQRKIIGANAHVVLQREHGRSFALPAGTLEKVDAVDGVVASSPYLQGEVAVASRANYTGALLFGIDPLRAPKVLTLLGPDLVAGSIEPLQAEAQPRAKDDEPVGEGMAAPAPLPHLVIGVEMQKSLSIEPGERLTVLSPLLENLTPLGPVPASRPFETAGVFSSKMYEFDARFTYAGLPAVRRFFQVGPDVVSGIQVRVEDPEVADRIGRAAAAALGDAPCPAGSTDRFDCGWESQDWKSRNSTLFAALKLERVVAFVVLVFIILVASFSIVNTLTMSVIEKHKEIAILKTMGARDAGIMKVFLVQGMLVGSFGTLLGAAAAVLTVLFLQTFGIWIPGAVYYIDSLPVHLEASDVVLVVLAALVIVWDFAVFPALSGSRLAPVEGLRDG